MSTYLTISLLFWYIGLIPDLATFRDRAKNRHARLIYGILAMGWRGSASPLAQLRNRLSPAGRDFDATRRVGSHGCQLRFHGRIIPGWHATIFPPYFVAGAIYSGFAMVLTLAIPLRKLFHLEEFITMRHIQNMAKLMLATGRSLAIATSSSHHSMVQRRNYERYIRQSYVRSVRVALRVADYANLIVSSGVVVSRVRAAPCYSRCRAFGQRLDVARVVRHRCDESSSGLSAVELGHVLPDGVGLGRPFLNHRLVLMSFPFRPSAAHDLDL